MHPIKWNFCAYFLEFQLIQLDRQMLLLSEIHSFLTHPEMEIGLYSSALPHKTLTFMEKMGTSLHPILMPSNASQPLYFR